MSCACACERMCVRGGGAAEGLGEYFMFLTECALPFLSQAAERFDGISLLYW